MDNQKLIIYDSLIIHQILSEIKDDLNFNIFHIKKDELNLIKNNDNQKIYFFNTKKNF